MKSRTSCFNPVLFRKNMTRFAPVWCLYTLCLLLGMFLMLDSNLEYWFAANLASMCSGMALINLGYALLTAQLLFGDLYNTRMCNALHAMPPRRECLFTTNVVSGLVFSLLPTAIMSALSAYFIGTYSVMEEGLYIPLYFFAASNLEYLFFFGLAVFAVFCSGNRLGMAVIYMIVNFASYLAFFFIDTLITPMYYGAMTPDQIYVMLCPMAYISQNPLIISERQKDMGDLAAVYGGDYVVSGTYKLTEDWLYVAVVAVIGVVLLLIARQMYRRRKLECAGDFLSTKKLSPVFMVLFSITVGTVFQYVQAMYTNAIGDFPLFLVIGLVVGWFAGRMLLERQVNVFTRLKNWLGIIALAAALVGVLYVCSLDPFGVEDWVPDASQVKKATMQSSYRGIHVTEDPEEIADIITIQRKILEDKLTNEEANAGVREAYNKAMEMEVPEVNAGKISLDNVAERIGYRQFSYIYISYELHNGWTVERQYYIWTDCAEAELANSYFSRVSSVFYSNKIQTEEDLLELVRAPEWIYVDEFILPAKYLTAQNVEALFEAIIADCEAGNMTQNDGFHEGAVIDTTVFQKCFRVDLNLVDASLYFNIYADSENCIRWMEETGIADYIEERVDLKYGS